MNRPRLTRKGIYVAIAIALITFGAGYAAAASIVSSSALSANGTANSDVGIGWWTESGSAIQVMPASGTTSVSLDSAHPTVLPAAGTDYTVGTATAGDIAQVVEFSENTNATTGAELEITFTFSTGSTPTITTTQAYLQIQASDPATAQTFAFYLDAGSAAHAAVTINSVTEISQVCSGAGSCP